MQLRSSAEVTVPLVGIHALCLLVAKMSTTSLSKESWSLEWVPPKGPL